MAVKKSTTKTAKTIIPARDRKAVSYTKRFMNLAHGKPITDREAYRSVIEQRKFTAARLAKERSEKEAEEKTRKREQREQAIDALGRGLSNLADVRDLLKRMERGQNEPFCVETLATFARATLADAGVSLEQSLLDLDLLERMPSGYFLETHFEQPEAQVTA